MRVIGYIAALKPQTGGSGESINCHWSGDPDVDWHIALVDEPGKGAEESVVVEVWQHTAWVSPDSLP